MLKIPSPSLGKSCDAFSLVSFETSNELTRKSLGDLEGPTVVQEDATMSTSTGSDTIYSYDDDDNDEYPLEDHSDCPLLQTVSVDRLPSRVIDQLDGRAKRQPSTDEFSLGKIPKPSCIGAFMASPFAMAVVAVGVAISKQVSVQSTNGGVAMGCIVAFFFGQILIILGLAAYGDYEIPMVGRRCFCRHLIDPFGV